ncbi:phosphoribosyl transferase [Burkholderia ubonensis]|uniref:phosphoribosyltransferase n=1 Tax=Burkholderia ubonensis TaxID=101571 RepID=UPI00075AA28B|nr:phosphoribosyltransferase family protein [Burkholderia ubonensis]KVD88298.1 phosphoribosyl transferase [Burkholderia ubonensis]
MKSCFFDRADAGRQLAGALHQYAGRADVVVLALPRGGVPVAYQVASALDAPLDVLVVRKLGYPYNPELAMGAIASGGTVYLQRSVIASMGVTDAQLAKEIERESAELKRREALYRGAREPVSVDWRTVIVVDDGIATGASMRVALQVLRERRPAHVVVAVPVSPPGIEDKLEDLADAFVVLSHPVPFFGISQFYVHFDQTKDDEVRRLLDAAGSASDGGVSPA